MKKLTLEVTNSDGSALVIEGFGPATILGAVDDVLSGAYEPPKKGVEVQAIEIRIEDA